MAAQEVRGDQHHPLRGRARRRRTRRPPGDQGLSGAFLAVSFGRSARRLRGSADPLRALTSEVGGPHRQTWGAADRGGVRLLTWQRESGLGTEVSLGPDRAEMTCGTAGVGIHSSVECDAAHVRAWCDDLGYGSLFHWEGGGVAAVSTRPELLVQVASILGRPPQKDPSIASELAFLGWLGPTRTGWAGIEAARAGTAVHLSEGRVRLDADSAVAGWAHEPAGGRSLDDLVDEAASLLRGNVARLIEAGPEIFVDLTAGRDSRMVVAAVAANGALDAVTLQTVGGPDLVDVGVAGALAESIGARHRSGYFYPVAEDDFRTRFRRHVALTAGVSNVKKGMREILPAVDHVRLAGQMGEVLRGWDTPLPRDRPIAEAVDPFISAFQGGRLDVLAPRARAEAEARMRAELLETGHGDLPAWFAGHRYYGEVRLRARTGRVDDFTPEVRAYPLYTRPLVGVAMEILWHHPGADLADLLIERLAPELDRIDVEVTAPPVPAPSAAGEQDLSFMKTALWEQAELRRSFFASLADVDSAAWDRLDRDAWRAAVDAYDDLRNPQLRLLHGAAGAILWLAD